MASNLENEPDDREENGEGETIQRLSAPRLVEGVRDLLLRWLKEAHMQKPWPKMSEREQRVWINRIEDRAHQLIDEVVEHVKHGDFPVVNASIDSFTVKAGVVKVVTKGFADNDMLAILNSAGEKRVQITVMRNDQFNEDMDPLHPDPDEPGLPGVKQHGEPGFDDEDAVDPEPDFEDQGDTLYSEVVDMVRKEGKAGPALIQRRFSIGYNRAVSLIERLEQDGIISAPDDKGVRTVIIPGGDPTAAELEEGGEILELKSGQWNGGYNSRMAGYKLGQNPFHSDSEEGMQWRLGWMAANTGGEAKPLGGEPTGDLDPGAEPAADPAPEPQEPAPEAPAEKPKATRKPAAKKAGPVVEPDIEPEEEPAPEVDTANDITDHEDVVIESAEHAMAYGVWCRRDGRGTGANPFKMGSEFYKAWMRGYNDQKKREETEEF